MSSEEAARPESLREVGRRHAVHEPCSLRRKTITGLGSGASLALALLVLAFTSESEEGVRSSSTFSLEEAPHMQWDPRHVMVHAPGLTVYEARAMHSLAQQKQWANLFTRRRTVSSMLQQVPAAVSASGRARLAKAREGMLAGNSWQTEEGDWVDRSSPDDPASINVRQVYEYVPNADGRRMSDGHGAKMWNDLQRSYFLQKPSMATYPAVPVVFRESMDGGQPVAHPWYTPEDDATVYGEEKAISGEKELRQSVHPVVLLERKPRVGMPGAARSAVEKHIALSGRFLNDDDSSVHEEMKSIPTEQARGMHGGARAAVMHAMGAVNDQAGSVVEGSKERGVLSQVRELDIQSLSEMSRKHAARSEKVHVPKAIVEKAQRMIKDEVVKELARKDEASLQADTDYIMGGSEAKEDHAHSRKSGGFSALRKIENRVISRLEQKQQGSELSKRKQEAAVRLAHKAVHGDAELSAELMRAATQGWTPQRIEAYKHKQTVRARALKLVHAFEKVGL